MTSRSTLCLFASLLLIASLAGAAEVSQATPQAAPAGAPAFLAPAATSPDCAKEELPFLNSTPKERATGFCGTCSGICAGASIGQTCAVSGGRVYACQYPYVERCTDGTRMCYCWTGPLP